MIYDKFGRTEGDRLIQSYYNLSENIVEKRAKIQAEKSYHYLKNDMQGINWHLYQHLKRMINLKTLNKMQMVVLNYTPRIINRLSLLYKLPAKRVINNNQEKYDELTSNLNQAMKETNRQGNLFNTILVRPVYDLAKKKFNYNIFNRSMVDIETADEDKNKLLKVSYNIQRKIKGKDEVIRVCWTQDEHYAMNMDGKEIQVEGIEGNDYGVLPFIVLRIEDCADFWGDGMPDIVNGNEHLNARLTDTFFKLYLNFGIPLGKNLNIKSEDFYISPDMPIFVDNERTDMSQADLKFVTPEQRIDLDKEVNNWFKNELAGSKGLPTSDIRYSSGFERELDMQEMFDKNNNDREVYKNFEYELFEMQKIILAHDGNNEFGNMQLRNIDYQEIKHSLSVDEKWKEREFEYKYNISTPLDWITEDNPDLNKDEAEEIIKSNKGYNDGLLKQKSRIESIIEKTGIAVE